MKKIGMIFSGYRSEFVGMGKDLYDTYRSVQEKFEEASSCMDTNFVKLCFASSEIEMRKVHNAYLALFLVQTSIVDLLKEAGITPCLVGGIDVGECSALYAARGISFADGLYFINKYTRTYETLITSEKYAQIMISECAPEFVEKICSEATSNNDFAVVSVYISATTFIVSGTLAAIDEVKKRVKAQKAVAKKIRLGSGFHSFIMDEIVKSIKMYLQKIDVKSTQIPFVSGTIGQTLTEGEVILASLMQQIHAPSYFESVITAFEECDVILHIGPSDWVVPLMASVFHEKNLYTVQNLADIEKCKKELI